MTENNELIPRLKAYFDEHFDEILADLNEIMSIESTYSEPSDGKPFGEGSAKALAWGARQGEALGLNVRNFDNYAVSMTFGENPVLGILSHLDVVPAGDGWTHEPFACTPDGDKIYGRGAIDDKGPSVAVLWAVKALRELNVPLSKGFRIIFGGNEEGGCEDIEYYEKCEPFPPMVFTPDGSFPVLNCEKGMLHLTFSAPFSDKNIVGIDGGTVINAIPDKCGFTSADGVNHICAGKSSHGSRPENGDNAVTKFLHEYKLGGGENTLLLALAELFPHGEFDGKSCGLGFSDEISGVMTCALTMLSVKNGKLCGGIDIRFPIDRTLSLIKEITVSALERAGFTTDECSGMEPHYVPADSPLVKTLLEVYRDVKGESGEPIAEGGITYVHNTAGGVAFGAEFPWENNNMHGADEHISVETFKYNLNMYANAIARICG
jgi:succinyl-diaminopimelate desuccinylase